MQVAMVSDVHGYLPALEVVLADPATVCPIQRFCLGDLVDYGPIPNEVIARLHAYLLEGVPVETFQAIASDAEADVILCGHTHRPYR